MNNEFKAWRLLIVGVMFLVFAFIELQRIWVSRADLMPIHGTLRVADVYVKPAKGDTRKAELVFHLNGSEKKFYLVEHIGSSYKHERYENILRGLKQADSITVWVNKSTANDYQPDIYQIDRDGVTLLDFKTERVKNRTVAAFLLTAGLGLLVFSIWYFRSEK